MAEPVDQSRNVAEAGRQAALDAYQILDTPADAAYDEIVQVAAAICGTPMALISLIDQERQWFKASVGLEVKETSREVAFCDHAIQQNEAVFEVGNAVTDPRFRTNPLVTGAPDLRFYAGAPLRTPDGHAVGTLCVLDTKPGSLTELQQRVLKALANQVVIQFELRKQLANRRVLEDQRTVTEDQLHQAQEAGGVGVFSVDLATGSVTGSPHFWRCFGLPPSNGMSRSKVSELVLKEDLALLGENGGWRAIPIEVEYRIRRFADSEVRWLYRRAEFELDSSGERLRMFGVVRDITEERRMRVLLQDRETRATELAAERTFVIDLTARQRRQTDPEEVMKLSAEALGQRLAVSRVSFYRLSGSRAVRYARGWTDGSMRRLHGEMAVDAFGARVERARRQGEVLAFSDSRHEDGLEAFVELGVLSGMCLSIHDQERWQGGLSIHHAYVRAWSVAEVALAKEVAELTWLAVERAEAIIRFEHRIHQQDETIGEVAGELKSEAAARSNAEEQLRQLQKMEAVGQLTGGIAHDFNNMLAVIIGALNLMIRRLKPEDLAIKRYADAALDGATRAAGLTQRLLAFARQQPLAPESLDANRLIADLSDFLRRTLGEQISLETVLAAGLWKAKVDLNQLENVLVNLATNARDAMEDGGKLTIETNNAHVDADYARQFEFPAGQYVQISVSDTGTGMSEEIMSRVFEPFFTTKAVGKGTGLGLAQVFGFVRQSGGHVRVYSEVGHGSVFKIYLPRHFGETPAPLRSQLPLSSLRDGTAREIILVVEDDHRVRELTVEAIRELGYTAIHAASAADALRLVESGQDFSLLFTDVVMPEMTGRQLADRVLLLRPHVKVVYTTGYTRNAIVHNGVIDPGTHFLAKPFGIEQLGQMLRLVLDESI